MYILVADGWYSVEEHYTLYLFMEDFLWDKLLCWVHSSEEHNSDIDQSLLAASYNYELADDQQPIMTQANHLVCNCFPIQINSGCP